MLSMCVIGTLTKVDYGFKAQNGGPIRVQNIRENPTPIQRKLLPQI